MLCLTFWLIWQVGNWGILVLREKLSVGDALVAFPLGPRLNQSHCFLFPLSLEWCVSLFSAVYDASVGLSN